MTTAIGYVRVSSAEQGRSGLGLTAQRRSIHTFCELRGWTLAEIAQDIASGGEAEDVVNVRSRGADSEFRRVLAAMNAGAYDALVVAKLDRLSRSYVQGAQVIAEAKRRDWTVVACDTGMDTSTPTGRFTAHIMVSHAELEREHISIRTKEALAAAKARGVTLGRRSGLPPEVRERIGLERAAGLTYKQIADGLNADGTPTGQGGRQWWPKTVSLVLQRIREHERTEVNNVATRGDE